jgi:DNA polymerase III alpha subunit
LFSGFYEIFKKDNRNYHIIIIPRTNAARKKVNLITSKASESGFYYKPRLFLEDLLKLDKDDIYIITTG